MKKLKILIPIILVIFILIIVLTYIGLDINKNRINNIIANETNQVQALKVIYKDFLKDCDGNIILDDSTLKNIITNEKFSEENQNTLKLLEINSGNTLFTYTLYAEYNPTTRVLKLTLEGADTSLYSKSYKLNVKNSHITYTPSKLSNYSIT